MDKYRSKNMLKYKENTEANARLNTRTNTVVNARLNPGTSTEEILENNTDQIHGET